MIILPNALHAIRNIRTLVLQPDNAWTSLNICQVEPVIHRLSMQVDDLTVHLQKIHKVQGPESYWHNHSWDMQCFILQGSYEMAFARNLNTGRLFNPFIKEVKIMQAGDSYAMEGGFDWHITSPISSLVYSVMITGPRFRPRAAKNHEPLTTTQIQGMLRAFRDLL